MFGKHWVNIGSVVHMLDSGYARTDRHIDIIVVKKSLELRLPNQGVYPARTLNQYLVY